MNSSLVLICLCHLVWIFQPQSDVLFFSIKLSWWGSDFFFCPPLRWALHSHLPNLLWRLSSSVLLRLHWTWPRKWKLVIKSLPWVLPIFCCVQTSSAMYVHYALTNGVPKIKCEILFRLSSRKDRQTMENLMMSTLLILSLVKRSPFVSSGLVIWYWCNIFVDFSAHDFHSLSPKSRRPRSFYPRLQQEPLAIFHHSSGWIERQGCGYDHLHCYKWCLRNGGNLRTRF